MIGVSKKKLVKVASRVGSQNWLENGLMHYNQKFVECNAYIYF